MGPAEVLRALLAEEVTGRDRSALATRRTRAAFPTGKTFDAWDQHLSSIPARKSRTADSNDAGVSPNPAPASAAGGPLADPAPWLCRSVQAI